MAAGWYHRAQEVVEELSRGSYSFQLPDALDTCQMECDYWLRNLWHVDFGRGGVVDKEVLSSSQSLKMRLFGGCVFAIVPVYVTSICSEKCLYCNFRSGNKNELIDRIRLTDSELTRELDFLVMAKGLRVIELVYATDPLVRVNSMCHQVELARRVVERNGGGLIGINAEALDESEYRSLVDAGLDFIVLWQETYDHVRYGQLHPGSTKKNRFEYRLEAYDRMIAAGIENFGMGVLSGLSDWRKDWSMLMLHEEYLHHTYGRLPSILGVPRLKPAAGATLKVTSFVPSSQEFATCIALHNLYSPLTLPFVNTREDWRLCLDLSRGGGVLFTFNCSTIPGGYTLGSQGNQFPTNSFDITHYAAELSQSDLHAACSWTFQTKNGQSIPTARW